MVYYVDFGVTHVLIPGFMERWLKKTSVDLGLWYYVYMASMAIFAPTPSTSWQVLMV